MLFWTRAFLCIGTITVLAIQRLPHDAKRDVLPEVSAPAAATLIGEACRARPDLCAAAVTRSLGAVLPKAVGVVPREEPESRIRPLHHGPEIPRPVALGLRSLT